MNFINRWAISLASSFEGLMNQVENHEALVSAAIREMQTSSAKARVQLGRVRRDGENLRRRHAELDEMAKVWEERAIRTHKEDKDKALECVRRKNQAERESAEVKRQLEEHVRLSEKLAKDLESMEERLNELRRKKNTFNARQYRAEALKAGQLGELGVIGEIDEIFDRWEVSIGEYETYCANVDQLDEEFRKGETQAELESQLAAMIKGQN